MKIFNPQKKIKRSKLFIDEKELNKIAKRYDVCWSDHFERVKFGKATMQDCEMAMEIYTNITKIIRDRSVKKK